MGIFDFFFKKNCKKQIADAVVTLPSCEVKNQHYISKDKTDLEKLTKLAQEKSDKFYHEHANKINKFHCNSIDTSNIDTSPLSSVEKSFLKYMDGKSVENPFIPVYWTYEYNLNYVETMNKLIFNGYISTSTNMQAVRFLTVPKLKQILSELNLSQVGKKQLLIDRILSSATEQDLEKFFTVEGKKFILTETGNELTKNIVPSITKDLEFEDSCLDLLYRQDFFNAYELIRKRELAKPMQRGIGINYEKPLSESSIKIYKSRMDRHNHQEQKAVAVAIFCDLMGAGSSNKQNLLRRLNLTSSNTLINSTNAGLSSTSIIETLKYLGSEYYEILSADSGSCKRCKSMNGKVFKVSEAKEDVNLPPFCDSCRCTIVPYFEDDF